MDLSVVNANLEREIDQLRGKFEHVKAVIKRPDWVPDGDRFSCASCNGEFSFVRRRHHCRHCGGLVCGGCSKTRRTLVHLGYEEAVRICDDCNQKLEQAVGSPRGNLNKVVLEQLLDDFEVLNLQKDEELESLRMESKRKEEHLKQQIANLTCQLEEARHSLKALEQKANDTAPVTAGESLTSARLKLMLSSSPQSEPSLPGTSPPTWVPDRERRMCVGCATQFSPVKRRHHCRQCGEVVCSKCSSMKVSLPELYGPSKKVRVCLACFESIEKDQREKDQSQISPKKVEEPSCSPTDPVGSDSSLDKFE